ncbi:Hypp996 [Branchiostoma lanceolatum]|uniref:Hypp996 protein n=1 Tax=Branchiostoma lanceolatum TaxID=7740 RepID=A0A8J9ZGL7_BRALA|nr:Hypp996 [Branchiostoma lanceolatum]
MLTKDVLHCRLRNLFSQKKGHYLRVLDAYNAYRSSYADCIPLDKFGGAIKECFPTVMKRRITTDNIRQSFYFNLFLIEDKENISPTVPSTTVTSTATVHRNKENISPTVPSTTVTSTATVHRNKESISPTVPSTTVTSTATVHSNKESIPPSVDSATSSETLHHLMQYAQSDKCAGTWCVTKLQNAMELCKLETKFVNGHKACRVVTVSNTLSVSVTYNGSPVDMPKMGLPSHINNTQEFENVLLKIGNTPACGGLRGQIYTQTKYPALKAAVETVCEDSAEPQQLLRSLECSQLVSVAPGAKVVRCTKCDSLRSAVKQARWRREKLKRVTGNVSQIPAKKTRWDFLSEEEKKNRYNAEQAKRVRADDRAEYHKDRYATLKETIRLAKEDHEDIEHMFNKMDSDVTKLFPKEHRKQLLWKIQRDHVLNKRNQWNPEFLDVCLQLWQRSKQGYADLKDSGFPKLPSERLLQYKKNTVNQRPGLHTEVFEWMNKEAEQQRVTERGRHGFIVFDEMKIQGSVQLRRVGDEFEIAGLVDMGDFYQSMQSLQTGGEQKAEMATHVFQVAFKGCEGFFFPFVWYPTTEIAPICIFNCHWDSVFYLEEYGFFSHACLCDGGQANRDFIKGHFGSEENAIAKKFTINNLYGEGSYSFIMDPPHNIKKLRNNLEKSTVTGTARCFKTRGQNILWAHLKEAYLHDKTNARAPLTSCKIRDGHFQLTPATRMRNHLASDVFSDDMLELLDVSFHT